VRITPTNPFHIARAYQAQRAPQAAPAPGQADKPAARIVAGSVPGGVHFTPATAAPAGPALPFYRHPADKNAAATSVSAGRMLDIQA